MRQAQLQKSAACAFSDLLPPPPAGDNRVVLICIDMLGFFFAAFAADTMRRSSEHAAGSKICWANEIPYPEDFMYDHPDYTVVNGRVYWTNR